MKFLNLLDTEAFACFEESVLEFIKTAKDENAAKAVGENLEMIKTFASVLNNPETSTYTFQKLASMYILRKGMIELGLSIDSIMEATETHIKRTADSLDEIPFG